MFVSIGLQLPMPLLTMYLIDHVVAEKNVELLNLVGASLLIFLCFKAAATYWQNFVLQLFRNRVMFDIRRRLFLHLEHLSMGYFGEKRVGYLTSRITADVNQLQGLLAATLLVAVRDVATFLIGLGLAFWINWQLALVATAILPFFALWIHHRNPELRQLRRETQEKHSVVMGDLLETLSNIYIVKSFAAERRELVKMLRSLRKALKTEFAAGISSTVLAVGATFLSSLGKLALIWMGCWHIMTGRLTIGGFLAFNSFLKYLFGPAESLVNVNRTVQESLAAVDRLFELLDEPAEPVLRRHLGAVDGEVEFRNVTFSYDGQNNVLDGIDLRVEPGTIVAIVGKSGSGKSTLMKLLMRMYLPNEGEILVDGKSVDSVSIRSLRKQIGLVPQDTFLFSGDVWENLGYGDPNGTKEDLVRCAKAANAHEFIEQLPQGYETEIGERGLKLSGGQRQRLSIAMAFVKDAPILILDEATSSVDSISEREIQDALSRLTKQRTTFVIAHRLSTVKTADQIVVLDQGRIVECGDHESLMNLKSAYYQLYSKSLAA